MNDVIFAASMGHKRSSKSFSSAKKLKTLRNLSAGDPGFKQDHVLTASVGLATAGYSDDEVNAICHKILDRVIARDLAISRGYATEIRRGRVPHPWHWQTLAKLVGVSEQK